jgi:hypothetical protein
MSIVPNRSGVQVAAWQAIRKGCAYESERLVLVGAGGDRGGVVAGVGGACSPAAFLGSLEVSLWLVF